jgi:protein phosphatase 1 regulatory subunit 7
LGVNRNTQIRVNDPSALDRDQIERELRRGKHVIVQFSHPSFYESMLPELDELCARWDENLGVRFYGHYSSSFDCNTILQIPNVKTLYVDCLVHAHNTEALTRLKNLYYLNLNVFELEDAEILRAESLQNLCMLTISSEKKTVNLAHLKGYARLHTLIAGGKVKNLDTIGHLAKLEFLSLNSISKAPVHFINKLGKLKTLKFILGGRESVEEIEENEIETLEIVRVRGFNNIQNIAKFRKLQKLLIEDQIQLNQINFNEPLKELKEISVLNCKGLTSLTGLDQLPLLQLLRIYKTSIDFDSFIRQKLPNTLSTLYFATSKSKVDHEIKNSLFEMGVQKDSK